MLNKLTFAAAISVFALGFTATTPLSANEATGFNGKPQIKEISGMQAKAEIYRCDPRLMKAVEEINRTCNLEQVLRQH